MKSFPINLSRVFFSSLNSVFDILFYVQDGHSPCFQSFFFSFLSGKVFSVNKWVFKMLIKNVCVGCSCVSNAFMFEKFV